MPQQAASRSIVIVGNGPIPSGFAGTIDAADLVIRFNDCRSAGALGGEKTDIVAVCNTGRPALSMLSGGRWKSLPTVRRAGAIWCTRDSARFAALRARLARSHPDLDDFCDDYTDGFRSFAAATGRAFQSLPASVHEGLDATLLPFRPSAYVVPSSGALVIAYVMETLAQPQDTVLLAGFSHQGWAWHPFAAERLYVDGLVAEGRIARADPVLTFASLQGD